MNRPTILDTADLVVVPKEMDDAMIEATWEEKQSRESFGVTCYPSDTWTVALSASPHPIAWEEVQKWEAEQAKRIRELEASLEAAEKVIEPFASSAYSRVPKDFSDDLSICDNVTIGDLRAAAKWMEDRKNEQRQ